MLFDFQVIILQITELRKYIVGTYIQYKYNYTLIYTV